MRRRRGQKLTTGAEGCAGELAEGNPKGDTSGAREATTMLSKEVTGGEWLVTKKKEDFDRCNFDVLKLLTAIESDE